ncbi:MAG: ABC transporter ATP-binding protein [Gammaproteobacteria bacterium]|nr:MAG: ABC transporter ATP-binding protein [Gammaproteobacteria bacterium]
MTARAYHAQQEGTMSIRFEQVTKRYRGVPVVNDVTLEVAKGEFFVLLGASGSGKSTLLRGIAGLTDIDHGRIALHGRDVTFVNPRDRGVGFVFQHYALFRNMSIADNIEFALRIRGVPAARRRERRRELLRLVALEGMDERLPSQLSGGQQQRVAVARALAHEPGVLLLDEPFGALDAKIRTELRRTVREVQRRLGTTTILVTHDQEEAFSLADRIGVMHMGRLLETGEPQQLYRQPATRFVATFLGAANLLLGEVAAPSRVRVGQALVSHAGQARPDAVSSTEVVTVLRPEDVELARHRQVLANPFLGEGQVLETSFGGGVSRLLVQVAAGTNLRAAARVDAQAHPGLAPGACLLEVTRTAAEAMAMPLAAGDGIALGVRRLHVLPTPVSSFLFRAPTREAVMELRHSPLVAQLVQSTRANLSETIVAEEQPGTGTLRGAGVVVVDNTGRTPAEIAGLVAHGARRLLCVPRGAQLPRRVIIHCPDDAPLGEAMGLVASLVRHINAEASFVSVTPREAVPAQRTLALRRLLDTRAEVRDSHGLDLRTEVLEGDVGEQLRALASGPEPALLVMGIDGDCAEIEAALSRDLGWLFDAGARWPLLLSYSGPRPAALAAVL